MKKYFSHLKAAPSSHIPVRRKKEGFRATYFLKTVVPPVEAIRSRQPHAGLQLKNSTGNIQSNTPKNRGPLHQRTCSVCVSAMGINDAYWMVAQLETHTATFAVTSATEAKVK